MERKALTVLAVLAVIAFLFVARAVFIPITIAIILSYALRPVVRTLQARLRVPRAIGAALVLLLSLGILGVGLVAVQPQAMHVLDIVPPAMQKLSEAVRHRAFEPPGAVERIQKAASEIEKAANGVAAISPSDASKGSPVAAIKVPAPDAGLNLRQYIVMGTASVIAGAGQLFVIVALTYLLLIAGDHFRKTLVEVTGESAQKKRVTLQILDEIDAQVQRYLFVQLASSLLLSLLLWIVFVSFGLQNALFFAVVGGVLHLIPYVGPTALVVVIGLVSYVQFDDFHPVLMLVGATVVISSFESMLLVPWLTQRAGKLNAVAVFVALLFWGWLWGIWGLLLGVPIVMAINAVCERVEGLGMISAFLGVSRASRI